MADENVGFWVLGCTRIQSRHHQPGRDIDQNPSGKWLYSEGSVQDFFFCTRRGTVGQLPGDEGSWEGAHLLVQPGSGAGSLGLAEHRAQGSAAPMGMGPHSAALQSLRTSEGTVLGGTIRVPAAEQVLLQGPSGKNSVLLQSV